MDTIKLAKIFELKLKYANVEKINALREGLNSFTQSTMSFFKGSSLDDKTKKYYIDNLNILHNDNINHLTKFTKVKSKEDMDKIYTNLGIVYNWFKSPEIYKGIPPDILPTLKSGVVSSFKRVVPLVKELRDEVK